MEPTTPKLPREAVELYDVFIHGEIDRRAFLDRVKKFAVGGLAVTAIVDALDAELRRSTAGPADRCPPEDRIRDRSLAAGQRQHQGLPGSSGQRRHAAKLPAILVIHENRGLNPHIEDVARRFALENFMAFAPDGLTSVGGYPGDDEKGGAAVRQGRSRQDGRGLRRGGGVAEERAGLHRQDRRDRLLLWRRRRQHAGRADGRRPGGRGAVLRRRPPGSGRAEDQGRDPGPSRREDTRLVEAWPAYEAALKAAGVTHEGHIYPGAVHGFNNDATPARYNKAAADQAWKRTIRWFNKYVRG